MQARDCVLQTFSQSDAKGILTRPSGKRHSLSHSIDHMSIGMDDRHSKKHSRELIPSHALHLSGQRSSHSLDHKRSQSPFETRVQELTVLTWIGSLRESISTVRFPLDTCAPQRRVAEMLTKNAFIAVQWKSLMQLFDIIHHPI